MQILVFRIRSAALFLSLVCLFAQPVLARRVADPSLTSFTQLETETSKFQRDKKALKFRDNYEKLATKWEVFAQKFPKSAKASTAFKNAADLYEKVAVITHFARDYKKAAQTLLLAADKAATPAEKDLILMRAGKILEVDLNDPSAALSALAPYVKASKTKPKSKRIAKTEALYAEMLAKAQAKAKAEAKAKVPTKTIPLEKQKEAPTVAEKIETPKPEPSRVERIGKVELLNSEKSIGLRIATTGELQIKHGVIPKNADSPRRVFFDLSRSALDPSVPLSFNVSKEGIKNVRLGQFKEDVVRVVVEAEPSTPFHVKADGEPVEIWFGQIPQVVAEESRPKEGTKQEVPLEEAPLGLALRKIVIDPGHGGSDPGAIGKKGLKEKDVTLAISKRLKKAIEKQMPGVRVFLTRDDDKFISLSERTQFANEMHADLFISIHVNSSPNKKTQGIETYYLNISHDRYAVRLASRENAMSESEISNLEFILADLAMKSNVSDSVRLGREVQSSVFGHMQDGWSDVKDLGLKHALFYVLLGARMPAVLVETAFISNKEDEKRLRTDRYQDAIVAGMVKGIRRYSEQKQAMYVP